MQTNRCSCVQRAYRCALAVVLASWLGFILAGNSFANDVPAEVGYRMWTGDFDGMQERRLIRILVPFSKTIYFVDKGKQIGTAVEAGEALALELNKGRKKEIDKIRVVFVPMSRDRLLPALVEGRGDILVANLTITPSRREVVDFTDPMAKGVREILVTGPSAPKIATLDDLAGKTVYARASSSYYEHLQSLNAAFKASGKAEIDLRVMDENLEDEDLMEMVNAGLLPWCIVDDHKADIWAKVFERVVPREDIAIAEEGEIAWAIRKDSPKLVAALNAFVKGHKVGTTFGNILKKRYYQNDKIVRAAYERSEYKKFQTLRALFARHAATYEFETLLIAAQGYQESKLDQGQKSPRGAVGIMQLLLSTAADKSVNISGIDKSADKNIEAGAKYMRHLISVYINEPDIDPTNRLLLGFAAYNAGPTNLRKAREMTTQMGLNPNVWFGNVENGMAKLIGRETVQYVSNIYKYYVAYSLMSEMQERNSQSKAQALK